MKNPKAKKSKLAIVAFAFSLIPVVAWLTFLFSWYMVELPESVVVAVALVLMSTGLGLYSQIAGLILGIIGLVTSKKMSDVRGICFSIAAIVFSVGWVIYLYTEGVERMMSYK